MNIRKKLLWWAPRILSIGFIIFVSLFALDVFSAYTGIHVLLPLLMHLLPSLLLVLLVVIAWKHAWMGALAFLGFAVFYVGDVGFTQPLSWYLILVLPATLIGLLYLLSWLGR